MKRTWLFLLFFLTLFSGFAQRQKDKIEMPEFPGGRKELIKYLEKNMVYPPDMYHLEMSGEVVVEFYVERSGVISGVRVIKSLSPQFDEEAIRLTRNMPQWKPGRKNKIPFRFKMTMPINFKLKKTSQKYVNRSI